MGVGTAHDPEVDEAGAREVVDVPAVAGDPEVDEAGAREVVDVPAVAGQEAMRVLAPGGLADHGVAFRAGSFGGSTSRKTGRCFHSGIGGVHPGAGAYGDADSRRIVGM